MAMRPAGEETFKLLLHRHYNKECYYCKSNSHSHQNCPNRPCYLCKKPGHISARCPYAYRSNNTNSTGNTTNGVRTSDGINPYHFTRLREITNLISIPYPHIPIHLNALNDAHVSVFSPGHHKSRICAAEWSPDGSLIVSGDKKGGIRIWAYKHSNQSIELTPHRCNVNAFAFDPFNTSTLYTCSADGTVCVTDMQAGSSISQSGQTVGDILIDVNPDGFISPSKWHMIYALCYDSRHHAVYCGASDGSITKKDVREESSAVLSRGKFHSKKITHICQNPVQPNLFCSSSNDGNVCLWDVRKFIPGSPLGTFTHDVIVSSAIFSPNSGAKLLTTSFDNRLRVWNDVHAFQGNCNHFVDSQPSITLIHSHDQNRYLTPFKACWDAKDWTDDTFVCGRFLPQAFNVAEEDDDSDDANKAILLKPVDIFSLKNATHSIKRNELPTPSLSLVDQSVPLTLTVNRFSPTDDILLSAGSFNLYLWSAPKPTDGTVNQRGRRLVPRRNNDDDDDDNNGDDGDDDGGDEGRRKKTKLSISTLRCKRNRTSKAAKGG